MVVTYIFLQYITIDYAHILDFILVMLIKS